MGVAILVIFAAIFLWALVPRNFLDIWWHLAAGKHVLASGVPKHDIFSHTVAGERWIDHEWLSQVLFYYFFDRFGMKSLLVLEALCVAASFVLLYKRSALLAGRGAAVAGTVAGYWLFAGHSLTESARPYMFTLFFVALFLYVLDWHVKNGGRRVWALPVLALVWANLHGGFIIGVLLLAIYALGSALSKDYAAARKLASVTLASIAASVLNPNTYELLLYPLQYARYSVHTRFISEWQSPTFHTFGMYEGALLAIILVLAVYKKPVNATDLLLLLVFTHFSLFAARNISLFAIVCIPIIVKYAERAASDSYTGLPDRTRDGLTGTFLPAFAYSFFLLGSLTFAYSYPLDKVLHGNPECGLPAGAVGFIDDSDMEGNMFNYYRWGGYVIWKLYPEHRVFIDGRADLYGDFIADYARVVRLEPGWDVVLDEYDVRFVLVPADEPLAEMLSEKGWRVAYEDSVSVVLKRGDEDAG